MPEWLTAAFEEATEYVEGKLELRVIEVYDEPPDRDAPQSEDTPAPDAER